MADLSVVISAPGLGDELQAIKAGILEIGDLLVVNKADRDDADETAKHLEAMLSLRSGAKRNISVLRVSATTGRGVSRLKDEINQLLETTGVAVGADRKRKRDARKLRLAVLRFASRISAGIPDEDFGSMRPEEFDRAIERSLAFLSTEIDD